MISATNVELSYSMLYRRFWTQSHFNSYVQENFSLAPQSHFNSYLFFFVQEIFSLAPR
jgi:hypothetical protein